MSEEISIKDMLNSSAKIDKVLQPGKKREKVEAPFVPVPNGAVASNSQVADEKPASKAKPAKEKPAPVPEKPAETAASQ